MTIYLMYSNYIIDNKTTISNKETCCRDETIIMNDGIEYTVCLIDKQRKVIFSILCYS